MTTLTFTQAKQIINNVEREGLEAFIEDMNNQPEFITEHQTLEVADVQAIVQGGCESGAYMPACYYSIATQTMIDHGDAVEAILAEQCSDWDFTFNPAQDSFSQFPSKLVSAAVEAWCYQHADVLDGVNWD